jgi:hypothetical protein
MELDESAVAWHGQPRSCYLNAYLNAYVVGKTDASESAA